jgi:hypothetical protein
MHYVNEESIAKLLSVLTLWNGTLKISAIAVYRIII